MRTTHDPDATTDSVPSDYTTPSPWSSSPLGDLAPEVGYPVNRPTMPDPEIAPAKPRSISKGAALAAALVGTLGVGAVLVVPGCAYFPSTPYHHPPVGVAPPAPGSAPGGVVSPGVAPPAGGPVADPGWAPPAGGPVATDPGWPAPPAGWPAPPPPAAPPPGGFGSGNPADPGPPVAAPAAPAPPPGITNVIIDPHVQLPPLVIKPPPPKCHLVPQPPKHDWIKNPPPGHWGPPINQPPEKVC
jgi:hypothetical protein